MRECSGRRWGLTHAPLRAGLVTAPCCIETPLPAPARGVRVSHESDPASGHDPSAPSRARKPSPNPKTEPFTLSGTRGCNEAARAAELPKLDHDARRARCRGAHKIP